MPSLFFLLPQAVVLVKMNSGGSKATEDNEAGVKGPRPANKGGSERDKDSIVCGPQNRKVRGDKRGNLQGEKDNFYVAWVFALELKLSKTLSGLVYFVLQL